MRHVGQKVRQVGRRVRLRGRAVRQSGQKVRFRRSLRIQELRDVVKGPVFRSLAREETAYRDVLV